MILWRLFCLVADSPDILIVSGELCILMSAVCTTSSISLCIGMRRSCLDLQVLMTLRFCNLESAKRSALLASINAQILSSAQKTFVTMATEIPLRWHEEVSQSRFSFSLFRLIISFGYIYSPLLFHFKPEALLQKRQCGFGIYLAQHSERSHDVVIIIQ